MTLDEEIKHCEEVAENQENFENFKCGYCKMGREDGVWKETCRYPSNIPQGSSWGECSELNCPLFYNCLKYAKERRQLAEWLRELQKYGAIFEKVGKILADNGYTMDDLDTIFGKANDEEVNADESSD